MSIKRRNSSWCVLLLLLRCEMKMMGTTARHLVDNTNKWSLTIWHSNLQMTDSLAIIVIEVKCNDEDDNGGCKLGRNSVKMVGDKVSCKLLRCKYLTSRACRSRWVIFHLAPFYFSFQPNTAQVYRPRVLKTGSMVKLFTADSQIPFTNLHLDKKFKYFRKVSSRLLGLLEQLLWSSHTL